MDAVYRFYHPLLRFAMRHKVPSLVVSLMLLGATGAVFSRMGGEFIPSLDEGDIAMQTFLRPGSSLSEPIKREDGSQGGRHDRDSLRPFQGRDDSHRRRLHPLVGMEEK